MSESKPTRDWLNEAIFCWDRYLLRGSSQDLLRSALSFNEARRAGDTETYRHTQQGLLHHVARGHAVEAPDAATLQRINTHLESWQAGLTINRQLFEAQKRCIIDTVQDAVRDLINQSQAARTAYYLEMTTGITEAGKPAHGMTKLSPSLLRSCQATVRLLSWSDCKEVVEALRDFYGLRYESLEFCPDVLAPDGSLGHLRGNLIGPCEGVRLYFGGQPAADVDHETFKRDYHLFQ